MKIALQKLSNGKTQLVNADGQALGRNDVDRPILHILPKLFVPSEMLGRVNSRLNKGLERDEIGLAVTSTLAVPIVPDDGIVIRQPYPNRRYFVGGSQLIRNGWIVPLPENSCSFDIEFNWHINSPALRSILDQEQWTIRHLIHIRLHKGDGITYSMDAACWPRSGIAPIHLSPVTLLGAEASLQEFEDKFKHRNIVSSHRKKFTGSANEQAENYFLEEIVDITGTPLEQAWSIDAFQHEQLHEVNTNPRIPLPSRV